MKNKHPLRWFRFYSEAVNDPKVQRLEPALFKTWVNFLCLASDGAGTLPGVDDIAFALRLSTQDAQGHVDRLIDVGLIDIQSDGRLRPHNWDGRQYVSDRSTDRVRKFREKNAKRFTKRDGNVSETSPDSDSEEEIYNKPSYLDATRDEEAKIEKSNLIGVGVEAQRAVARALNIGDPAPIVSAFLRWPKSRGAKSPDAMFVASAAKIYARLKPAQRAACQPLDDPEPEPLPPVQASSALRAKLAKGNRHGR